MKKSLRYSLNLFGAAVLSTLLVLVILSAYFTHQWTWSILHPSTPAPTGELFKAEGIPVEDVKLTTQDGLDLAVWYTPPQNGAVILIAHGYNDNRPESIHALFVKHGYGALSWDFRAHGGSDGDLSTLGYYERMDVKVALDFALAQAGVEHVGAWGGSMGAATLILSTAENPEIEALVADSAYPSLEDVLHVNMPVPFFQPFVLFWGEFHSGAEFDEVNPEAVIGQISPRPVFIIDGWEGGAVVMNSPYRLYDAANEPKELWVEDGVPHLGMLPNNPKKYENRVVGFFDEWLLGKPSE